MKENNNYPLVDVKCKVFDKNAIKPNKIKGFQYYKIYKDGIMYFDIK